MRLGARSLDDRDAHRQLPSLDHSGPVLASSSIRIEGMIVGTQFRASSIGGAIQASERPFFGPKHGLWQHCANRLRGLS